MGRLSEWERFESKKWAFFAKGETDSSESNETFSAMMNSLMASSTEIDSVH